MTDVNRYRSGEIDMTYNNMPIELFQKLKKEIPKEVHVDPYLCTYYYEINNQKAPFTDVRVRTALETGAGSRHHRQQSEKPGATCRHTATPRRTPMVQN